MGSSIDAAVCGRTLAKGYDHAYSCLSATIGSTDVARRAGTKHAARPAPSIREGNDAERGQVDSTDAKHEAPHRAADKVGATRSQDDAKQRRPHTLAQHLGGDVGQKEGAWAAFPAVSPACPQVEGETLNPRSGG